MIRTTTNTKRLRDVFYRIFKSRDPFKPAGREDFPIRVILFPTDIYYLEANQFRALTGAMHDCGEKEFFLSMVESEPEPRNWDINESTHWVCEEPTYEEYRNAEVFLENALYSTSGKWGILVSHEQHALLVCNNSFWDTFQMRYPNWKRDKDKFIENWHLNEKETGCDIRWIQPLLAHLTI